jgi:hypothetical protein
MRQPVIAAGLLSGAQAAAHDRDGATGRARQGPSALGRWVRWRQGLRARIAGAPARVAAGRNRRSTAS